MLDQVFVLFDREKDQVTTPCFFFYINNGFFLFFYPLSAFSYSAVADGFECDAGSFYAWVDIRVDE